jgi:alpha-acetolactate decarboxylase
MILQKYILGTLLLLATIAALVSGCASMGSPTGGVRDTIPPQMLASVPKDQSTGFKGNVVALEFDEYVNAKNLTNNLVVTPRISKPFEYEVRKRTLLVKFEPNTFAENTTYVLAFNKAIEDMNERNELKSLRLAFSTGESIDTLFVAGNVKNLLSGKREITASVLLYDAADTFQIEKHKPMYSAQTDTTGYYRISNVKPGRYKIYALAENEKKTDLIYNNSDERIAFSDSTVRLQGARYAEIVNLQTVSYDLRPLRVVSGRTSRQNYEVKLSKPIKSGQIRFTDASLDTTVGYLVEKDVFRVFNLRRTETDSLSATFTFTDSTGNQVTYDAKVKFGTAAEAANDGKNNKKPKVIPPFPFSELPANGQDIRAENFQKMSIQFAFTKPITQINTDSIFYKIDKDTIKQALSVKDFVIDTARTRITLTKNFSPETKLTFSFQKGAFISYENDSSMAKTVAYAVMQPKNYATISGEVNTAAPHFIVQLLDEKTGRVEQEIFNQKIFKFLFVKPGTSRRLRVVIDTNNNKRWDSGDFRKGILPEKVFFYDGAITDLKANWDYEDHLIETDSGQE